MAAVTKIQEQVVIKFAGDSGDGMQLTGGQFTNNTALIGNDIATFPDYPAEIRAPQGTLAGVSGFQIHFGSKEVLTPGDSFDVLVAMNAAALKTNLPQLKRDGTLICNTSGFDAKYLRLAQYDSNPLDDGSLEKYQVFSFDVTKMTRDSLKESSLTSREKDRSKNMFVLGFLYWMYSRDPETTVGFLKHKFANKPDLTDANIKALKAGYHFADTTETFSSRYKVQPAKMPPGRYRNIRGSEATALGLITASKKSGLQLFLGSYPITPASDILHELSKHKNFGVRTFQAEDEIASISAAIGASFGGDLAVTTTSGPGMALKSEAMGLAVMLELPLVVCDIQRSGPSTGMPTKTEQADLLQALYGRNGESPIPVLAASTPSDCFETIFEACRIAIQHMTPVIFLGDGYIANGAEPWKFPKSSDIPEIKSNQIAAKENGEKFQPYIRDEKKTRPWAIPGKKGLEHRLGGLEKDDITGNVSYDPDNHQYMVKLREEKVERIAGYIPEQKIDNGPDKGDLLVIGWGSTYGSIKAAVQDILSEGYKVSHIHLRYIKPFPRNLGEIIHNFDRVLVPEINNGQLIKLLRDKYLIPAEGFNKIRGVPLTRKELKEKMLNILNE